MPPDKPDVNVIIEINTFKVLLLLHIETIMNSCIGVRSGGQGGRLAPPPSQGFKLGTLTHNETYAPKPILKFYPPSQNIFLRLCLGDGG